MENLVLMQDLAQKKIANRLKLLEGPAGHIKVVKGDVVTLTTVKRCFPWTHPLSHFSLRDEKDKEVEMIEHISVLDPASQEVLQKALEEAGFCFVIRNLLKVEEDFELRQWSVETAQGPRQFQTKLMDWPREVPGGGLLIQDVAKDIYYVPQIEKLPEPGKTILWAFLD